MGIGARVTVSAGGMTQIDEVRGGGSYNSSNDTRLHFGLAKAANIDRITVQWPSGVKQEFTGISADVFYVIHEEKGISKVKSFAVPTQ